MNPKSSAPTHGRRNATPSRPEVFWSGAPTCPHGLALQPRPRANGEQVEEGDESARALRLPFSDQTTSFGQGHPLIEVLVRLRRVPEQFDVPPTATCNAAKFACFGWSQRCDQSSHHGPVLQLHFRFVMVGKLLVCASDSPSPALGGSV